MSGRALVSVEHPHGEDAEFGEPWDAPEALVLTCTEHGELTDWESLTRRAHLQWLAKEHANSHHDGDVDAAGWSR